MKYKQLPIYKISYDILVRIMQMVKNFSREYKYTLGEKIQKEAIVRSSGIAWLDHFFFGCDNKFTKLVLN